MDFYKYGENADGPYVTIRRDRVTAIESIWHSRYKYSVSRLHLIGGETIDVTMSFDNCRAWYTQDPKDPVLASLQ